MLRYQEEDTQWGLQSSTVALANEPLLGMPPVFASWMGAGVAFYLTAQVRIFAVMVIK